MRAAYNPDNDGYRHLSITNVLGSGVDIDVKRNNDAIWTKCGDKVERHEPAGFQLIDTIIRVCGIESDSAGRERLSAVIRASMSSASEQTWSAVITTEGISLSCNISPLGEIMRADVKCNLDGRKVSAYETALSAPSTDVVNSVGEGVYSEVIDKILDDVEWLNGQEKMLASVLASLISERGYYASVRL